MKIVKNTINNGIYESDKVIRASKTPLIK